MADTSGSHGQDHFHAQRSGSPFSGSCRTMPAPASQGKGTPGEQAADRIAAAMVVVSVAAFGQATGPAGNAGIDATTLSSISKRLRPPDNPCQEGQCRSVLSGRRVTCIVDGDTFWMEGVKYRIANIDTPELKGRCKAEKAMAIRARTRLEQLMSGETLSLSTTGTDPHGRTLVLVSGSGAISARRWFPKGWRRFGAGRSSTGAGVGLAPL